ncbi:MAG: DUF5615 family PIN-like protein [Bacillota bacterium]
MRFIIDMPLSPKLSAWLATLGHDAVHAFECGLQTVPDSLVLERALAEGRIIVTADLDYTRLLALVSTTGPGPVLVRGGNYSDQEIQSLLKRVLLSLREEDLVQSIVVVDRTRIRRRRLPIDD